MIFVTVGTQLPFDRLIRAVDAWAGSVPGRDVFAQTGEGAYVPRNIRWSAHLHPAEFRNLLEQADFVVAHAGMGTILSALELGKPVVILPRQARYGEHRNDHQLATAARFENRPLIRVAYEESELPWILNDLCRIGTQFANPSQRISESASPELIERLRTFILGAETTEN